MLWIKAFHIIAVVCWFAALFYLPRLFVYHSESQDKISQDRFIIMERRLYRGIMTPAMHATFLFGGWMLYEGWAVYSTQGWMHAKLTLIALLTIYHLACGRFMRQFAAGTCQRGSRYFRIFNELPVLILIAVVILVEVQPF